MTHAPTPALPRPLSETWADARTDYLAGVAAPVVAERYGLSERSLRRRAAVEGWRRIDIPPVPLDLGRDTTSRLADRATAIEMMPELEEVDTARHSQQLALLFQPTPDHLRQFAFARAAEAAAIDAPHSAVIWMRLAQIVDRCGDRIQRETATFSDLDLLRAAYLGRLGDRKDKADKPPHD